jgi:hypothetical protein
MAVTIRARTTPVAKQRFNIELEATVDPREFKLPEPALHTPPTQVVRPYHNGRRMKTREYEVKESVLGGGLDLVRILTFAPDPTRSVVFADYTAA